MCASCVVVRREETPLPAAAVKSQLHLGIWRRKIRDEWDFRVLLSSLAVSSSRVISQLSTTSTQAAHHAPPLCSLYAYAGAMSGSRCANGHRLVVVEGDLLGLAWDQLLEVVAVARVGLLLDRGGELGEILGHLLVGILEHADELACVRLVHLGEEGETLARLATATSTADAVHIVLDGEREGVVDDVLDVGDVQSTRRHIGSHQQRRLGRFEALQRRNALVLAKIAMDTRHLEAATAEGLLDALSLLLVQRKDEDLVIRTLCVDRAEEVVESTLLGIAVREHLDRLLDTSVRRELVRAHRDTDGAVHERLGQSAHRRQAECKCLAGSRLCNTDHVLVLKQHWPAARLDGCGRGEALCVECLLDSSVDLAVKLAEVDHGQRRALVGFLGCLDGDVVRLEESTCCCRVGGCECRSRSRGNRSRSGGGCRLDRGGGACLGSGFLCLLLLLSALLGSLVIVSIASAVCVLVVRLALLALLVLLVLLVLLLALVLLLLLVDGLDSVLERLFCGARRHLCVFFVVERDGGVKEGQGPTAETRLGLGSLEPPRLL
ncbi:hypothetical protein L1887_59340 [Cichorium endivia]|nr:hypothetical protein L1887_59340 [Cichorium endivia]